MRKIFCQNCGEEISLATCVHNVQVTSETFLKCVQEDDFSDMYLPEETVVQISCSCFTTKLSEEDSEFISGYFSSYRLQGGEHA